MVTRTDGPFHYYQDIHKGVNGDTIRADAHDPGLNAQTIHALASDLKGDDRKVATQMSGDITADVRINPQKLSQHAATLAANGFYAVGLVSRFAHNVDQFDTRVNTINVDYNHQMSVLRKYALGLPLSSGDGMEAMLIAPLYGVTSPVSSTAYSGVPAALVPSAPPTFDAKAVGSEVYKGLQGEYAAAEAKLDRAAHRVATMFNDGPTPDHVHSLMMSGLIPLSAATLYPGLKLTTADIKKALGFDPAFTDPPKVTDPRFKSWFANLTPWQKQLAMLAMSLSFNSKDFHPFGNIKPGTTPAWAKKSWTSGPMVCTADGDTGGKYYGYFTGGSILGPGGVQWPIVEPYMQDGSHIYMADAGQTRPDGGINDLDGHDPGWTTVATYRGLDQFPVVSTSTKIATAFLIGTGQELETTHVDPGAVVVGPDGTPHAGSDVQEVTHGPPDKAYWDIQSEYTNPESADKYVGPLALTVQAGQAAQAVNDLDSHNSRQYYVAYQVNDDGRTRAIVHTYTAGAGEDGKTLVGSFANTYPDGTKSTTELGYNTRFNPYDHAVMTAQPDPNVEYTGHGEPQDNTTRIHENFVK